MISLNMYIGKSWVLFGFLLLVSCVTLMKATKHSSLDATTLSYEYSVPGVATASAYNPSSKYAAFPIDPTVTGMANPSTPLSSAKDLLFHPNGSLELSGSDQNQNSPWDIWYTSFSDNTMDLGKLELKNINGTESWRSFDSSPPTDTLLSGQSMYRSRPSRLMSSHACCHPKIANITALRLGTDRILYSRDPTVDKLAEPPSAKDGKWVKWVKWVKILASVVGILGVLLAIFCLRRYEKIRQWLWACVRCGLCYKRPKPSYEIKFPGDTPVRTELEDGGVELEVEEQRPRCHCAVSCVISFK